MVFIAAAVCFIRVYSCTNAVYNAALISAVVISEVVLIPPPTLYNILQTP